MKKTTNLKAVEINYGKKSNLYKLKPMYFELYKGAQHVHNGFIMIYKEESALLFKYQPTLLNNSVDLLQ